MKNEQSTNEYTDPFDTSIHWGVGRPTDSSWDPVNIEKGKALSDWRYPNNYIQFPVPHFAVLSWISAGTVSATLEAFVTHPFDTVKTRMQAVWFDDMPQYKNSIDCIKRMNIKEGNSAFFRGVSTSVGIGPLLWGWRFLAQEIGCAIYLEGRNPLRRVKTKERFVVGYLTGVLEAFVNCPLELIKTRRQLEGLGRHLFTPQKYEGFILQHLWKYEHMGTPYKGLMVTMMRDGLFTGGFFATFHFVRYRWFAYKYGREAQIPINPPLYVTAGAAAIGGIMGSFLSHPFDMLKLRRQHINYWKNPTIYQSYEIHKLGELRAWKRLWAIRGENVKAGSMKGIILGTYALCYLPGEGSGLLARMVGKSLGAALLVTVFDILMRSAINPDTVNPPPKQNSHKSWF